MNWQHQLDKVVDEPLIYIVIPLFLIAVGAVGGRLFSFANDLIKRKYYHSKVYAFTKRAAFVYRYAKAGHINYVYTSRFVLIVSALIMMSLLIVISTQYTIADIVKEETSNTSERWFIVGAISLTSSFLFFVMFQSLSMIAMVQLFIRWFYMRQQHSLTDEGLVEFIMRSRQLQDDADLRRALRQLGAIADEPHTLSSPNRLP